MQRLMLRNMQGFCNNQHGLIYMYFKHTTAGVQWSRSLNLGNSSLKAAVHISTKYGLKTCLKTLLKCFASDALCSKAKHLKMS